MSEIAMVSSRKSRLELEANKGEKTAEKALELSRNPGKFLSTVQIGITLIGILLGIYSGEKIADDFENFLNRFEWLENYSETLSLGIIVVVLTFLSMVLGELLPKRIGLTMPESITKFLSYPMYFISLVAAPFIWILTITTDLLMRLLHINKSRDNYITEEEIRAIVQEATRTGIIEEIEQDIVENVFHLGDRKINSLMTPRTKIEWLNTEDSIETTKSKISSSVHKSFPVCSRKVDNVAGFVYSKDLLNSLLKNEKFVLEKYLKKALFLPEDTTAYGALEKLRESKQNIALVIDKSRSVKGILSINDLLDTLVSDFDKEMHERKAIIPREDGSFLVDASLPFPEFARYFNIEIKKGKELSKIETVGQLAFKSGKKVSGIGHKFIWKNLYFEIMDMDGRRIDKFLVKKLN